MAGFGDVLKDIAARCIETAELEQGGYMKQGDYIKDGLIYCGKCNTPRQARVDIGNGEILNPPSLCDCRAAARDKAEADKKAAELKKWADKTRYLNIRDEKLLEFTFERDKQPDSKYTAIFKRYCDKWEQIKNENIGLILWGETGRGKSFYAGCICNQLINKGVNAYATTEPLILNDLFERADKSTYINRLASYPLLLIDDFGTARNTSYAQEQIYTVIDERYKANLPTIITTNLSPARFDAPESLTEQRIFDRLKAMGQFIEIKGKNWRQEETNQKAAALLNIINGGD